MPFSQKSRKNTNINHNRAKQACVNTADPATHLKDVQHEGWICRECGKMNHFTAVFRSMKHKAVHEVEQELDECREEDGQGDMVNNDFINFNQKAQALQQSEKLVVTKTVYTL